ncbi:MAG: polymer-forming cytoskeletal protein [Alphaproteobacteria bacterium]|nr:polymer-forming cytoskeletal protein [Alphaproteobacteria bacterium]
MSAAPSRRLLRPLRAEGSAVAPLSHLSKAITINGDLESDGELQIYGNVRGQVCADRLVVGAGGFLEGDVIARDVHIEGRMEGRIFALNVTLDSGAEVNGRIFHNTITVAKGARIDARMPWRPPSYFETLETLPEARQ